MFCVCRFCGSEEISTNILAMKTLRIGTRKSQLALWQANYVRDALLTAHRDIEVELVEIISEGDKMLELPLSQAGGKGLFAKELELALLDGSIDLAVHSMKDVTVNLPDGLHIPVVCPREDPRDAFVSNEFESLSKMPEGSLVGTCSLRRQCQVLAHYPYLETKNLRGNVNTRLAKLDDDQYAAIILAVSGLKRLAFDHRITEAIDPSICLPAVGQGIVGIECRMDDQEINQLIAPLNDSAASVQVNAERAVNQRLGGGCHVPIAAFAELKPPQPDEELTHKQLRLRALVGEVDGSRILRSEITASASDPVALGFAVADHLISQGAADILASVYDN